MTKTTSTSKRNETRLMASCERELAAAKMLIKLTPESERAPLIAAFQESVRLFEARFNTKVVA